MKLVELLDEDQELGSAKAKGGVRGGGWDL